MALISATAHPLLALSGRIRCIAPVSPLGRVLINRQAIADVVRRPTSVIGGKADMARTVRMSANDPKRTQETLVLEFFQSARVNGTIGGFSKRSPSIELYFADAHPK